MDEWLEVVFDLPLDSSFTYRNSVTKPAVPGCRVMAPFRNRSAEGFVVSSAREKPAVDFDIKSIERAIDREPLFTPDHVALAEWMASYYLCSRGEVLSAMLPGGRREMELPETALCDMTIADADVTLSAEQRAAFERICSGPGNYYLFGMTGSGKTEVFMQAAERMLASKKGVIYLVPEIALTHQVIDTVRRRFGNQCAVLHSGLTPSQKLSEWNSILSGEKNFVVGARSAVFAPVRDLGLIVIDEEHEGTYKSGTSPRYHARQVAMKRCSGSGAALVMGSATPSLEAYYLMKKGVLARLDLSARLSGGALPDIGIVPMAGEQGTLSSRLKAAIAEALEGKRQVILFLNRRGFSYYYHCRSCGWTLACTQCSVSLTYHKSVGKALCHYCGYSAKPLQACPECGSLDTGYTGFGTELVEEEVARLFPGARIARADADTAARKGELERILREFRSGSIDILLGTQMVAKGLNFPGVKLVGVVLADTSLRLPDFRSAERTFSLITQVAGRAGRYTPDGKVLVQTFRPQADAVTFAARHDIEGFFDRELSVREMTGFPPYTRLIRFVFRSKSAEAADKAALDFVAVANEGLVSGVEVLGPAECPIAVIAGNARRHAIMRGEAFARLHAAAKRAVDAFVPPRNVYMEVDLDPVSLL